MMQIMEFHSVKILILVVGALALGTVAGATQAQMADRGFYLGGSLGAAKYNSFNELCRDITGALPGFQVDASCDSDESVFGGKLYGGWRWNQYVALEGGFASLGGASGNTVIFGNDVNGEISVDALFLELVASAPLGERVRVFGKLGGATIDAELNTDVFPVPLDVIVPEGTSFSKSFTEPVFGAGLEFGFTEKLMGRIEWERYNFEDGIDFFSAGLLYYPGK